MSTEIATWNMIRSKIPTFPSPTAGRGNECLTKTEIQNLGGLYVSVNGNYENSECVMLKDILQKEITWVYTFIVSSTSLSFTALGGTQSVSIISYKEQYIGGIPSGTRVNVGFTSSSSSSWLSSTGTSVTVQENTATSRRSGTITYTQAESGKIIQVAVEQREAVITKRGNISCTPVSVIFYNDEHTKSYHLTVSSIEITYINGKYVSSVPVPWHICKSDGTSCGSYVTIKNPNTMISCIKNSDTDIEFYLANVSSNSIGFSSSVNLSQVGSNGDTWNVSISIRKRL